MNSEVDSQMELVEGLKKAARGNSRSKTARLREIFDEVEAAKNSGLSLKVIVAVLADRGLVFDLATFVNVRHRIKKEREFGKQKTIATNIPTNSAAEVARSASPVKAVGSEIKVRVVQKENVTTQTPPKSANKLEEKDVDVATELSDKQKREKFADKFVGSGNKLLDSLNKGKINE